MADYRNYSADRTQKRCHSCKRMLNIDLYRVRSSRYTRKGRRVSDSWINNVCRECESAGIDQYRTKTKLGVAAEIVRRTKSKCAALSLPFDLDRAWVLRQLDEQKWACALTRIPFNWKRVEGARRRGFSWDAVSVDRIQHKRGYTKGNVRFILNAVNLFRNDGSDVRMYAIAAALLQCRLLHR